LYKRNCAVCCLSFVIIIIIYYYYYEWILIVFFCSLRLLLLLLLLSSHIDSPHLHKLFDFVFCFRFVSILSVVVSFSTSLGVFSFLLLFFSNPLLIYITYIYLYIFKGYWDVNKFARVNQVTTPSKNCPSLYPLLLSSNLNCNPTHPLLWRKKHLSKKCSVKVGILTLGRVSSTFLIPVFFLGRWTNEPCSLQRSYIQLRTRLCLFFFLSIHYYFLSLLNCCLVINVNRTPLFVTSFGLFFFVALYYEILRTPKLHDASRRQVAPPCSCYLSCSPLTP